MPKITITKITPKGDKVVLVDYTVEGKPGPQARAWKSQADGWTEGSIVEAEFEKKPGYQGGPDEVWIKSPARQGGFKGGGGGGQRTQRTPEDIWAIVMQTCIKSSAEIQVALIAAQPKAADEFDINKVIGWAEDLYDSAASKVAKTVQGRS